MRAGVPSGCRKKLVETPCNRFEQSGVHAAVGLRSGEVPRELMLVYELNLPCGASWKTPSPDPNAGPGRLKNAGCMISTASGGSGASKMPS